MTALTPPKVHYTFKKLNFKKTKNIFAEIFENIQAFIDDLIIQIDMKKMGLLHTHCLPDTDLNRKKDIVGYSFCQFIETSSIVGHICETSRTLYLDVFSCKSFDADIVKNVVIKYFGGAIRNEQMLVRDANFCS